MALDDVVMIWASMDAMFGIINDFIYILFAFSHEKAHSFFLTLIQLK